MQPLSPLMQQALEAVIRREQAPDTPAHLDPLYSVFQAP